MRGTITTSIIATIMLFDAIGASADGQTKGTSPGASGAGHSGPYQGGSSNRGGSSGIDNLDKALGPIEIPGGGSIGDQLQSIERGSGDSLQSQPARRRTFGYTVSTGRRVSISIPSPPPPSEQGHGHGHAHFHDECHRACYEGWVRVCEREDPCFWSCMQYCEKK
jgi:hypothetical protein